MEVIKKFCINYEENPDYVFTNLYEEILNKKQAYDFVYEDVQDIAIIANSYGSKLFGGVVRSFILRKEDTNDKKYEEFIEVISKTWDAIETHKYYGDRFGSKENQEKFRKDNKYLFDKFSYSVASSNTGLYIV